MVTIEQIRQINDENHPDLKLFLFNNYLKNKLLIRKNFNSKDYIINHGIIIKSTNELLMTADNLSHSINFLDNLSLFADSYLYYIDDEFITYKKLKDLL
jgi:hypothetical protein